MKMKKFIVYLDDGDAYKCAIPAQSEEAAREYAYGNGEVIAVKDVTEKYVISAEKVRDALRDADFDRLEMDFITRALQQIGICE